jgi:formate dehydrogenase subunit gamma
VREIAEELAKRDGPLLPILHEIQTAFGYIPDDAVIIVADVLNLTRAEVHGTVTFYHDFRTTPPAPTIVKLCRAEACQAMGVNALAAELETLVDNQTSLEKTYCLGLCATAPAAMVNDQVHGRLTAKRLHRLIEAAK